MAITYLDEPKRKITYLDEPKVLDSQPEQGDFKKHFPAYEVPEKGYKPQAIWTPEAVKKTQPQSLIKIADSSGKPDDYYASIGNAKFFSEKFRINPDDALKRSLSIGRAIYQNSKLTDYQINKLIDEDIKNGSFDMRVANAKWTQYGLSNDEARAMNEIYESDWKDNLEFAASIPAGGLAKAFFGTVSGAADLVGIDTPFSDELVAEIEEIQLDHLNKSLLTGDYTKYGMGLAGKTVGDVYGNLKLMGQAIKAANLWTGGSMSMVAKGNTLKSIASSTSKKALFLAGLNFVRTPGTYGDKAKAFGVTMAYMNTPILSSMSPTHFSAFFNDFLLNSGITLATGQYKDVWEESEEIAEQMGTPDDAQKIFIAKAIPLLGSDLAFSALTRSAKQNRQTELLKSYIETSRVLEQKGAVSVKEFEGALQKKYGDGWDKSMTEADRTKYEALKTANDAVKSGGLSEQSLKSDPIDTQARIQIENDKVYYRDKDGTLRDIEGAEGTFSKSMDAYEKERSSLISKITKRIPDRYSYEQKKALAEIQQSVLKPKNDKVQYELDRVSSYLKDNPDAKLPPRITEKLGKTSLDKLTNDELRVIADETIRLRKQAYTKFKIENKRRGEQNKADAETIQSTMKAPKPEKIRDIGGKQKGKGSIKFTGTRPDRFFDMLDGAKGAFKGLAHDIFIDKTREARAKFNEMKDARLSGGERLIKDLGMRVKDFNKKIKIDVAGKPAKLTTEQMMGVYAGSKNRLNRAAILHGNFKGDEAAMQKVIDMVENDSRLKTIADYIIYDFANNTGRVFDSVGRNEGKVLDLEEYYIPMRRSDVQQKTSVEDMHNDVIGRADIIKTLPDSKFKISRQEVPDALQNKVDINLLSLWEREVGLQEHYIAQMGNVKQMRGVLESGDFAKNLKGAYGENAPKYVSDFIDTVANPMSIYQHDGWAKVSRRLRKNIASAYLAGNVKTMIKQFPSLALYSGEVSPARLANALAEVTGAFEVVDGKSRNTILDFVSEKDPLIKHSHIQRELDELRLSDKNKYDQFMDKVGEQGFKGILAIDRLARSAGWYAVYKKAIEGGKSEDEAIRLARNATARTQPTAAAEELPPIYRTHESLNWLLMFSNQLNQIWNMGTKDVPRRILRGDMKEKVAGIAEAGGLAMSAMAIWAVNNGRLPESPDEVRDAMSENAMASVPLIGSHLVNGYHGYDSAIPIVEFASESGKAFYKTADGDMTPEELADYAWRNVAPALGIPVVALGRVGEAKEEKDIMKITGIKKKEPKKKKVKIRGGSTNRR